MKREEQRPEECRIDRGAMERLDDLERRIETIERALGSRKPPRGGGAAAPAVVIDVVEPASPARVATIVDQSWASFAHEMKQR